MTTASNPGSRPHRGAIVALTAVTLGLLTSLVVLAGGGERAEASELAAFTSCSELTEWGRQSQEGLEARSFELASEETFEAVGGPVSTAAAEGDAGQGAARSIVPTAGVAEQSADGTNVIVAGVDELDLVDRVDEQRALVVSDSTLSLVDVAAARVLASTTVPAGSQVTFDPTTGVAWAVGYGLEGGVLVQRVVVADAGLDAAGQWSTAGALVTARRVDDRLHLVATDGFMGPAGDVIPFAGGPVPCDQVLHPVGPSDPSATLIVTLPATGDLQPLAATEVVGSGQLVHLTTEAAYLATPLFEDATVATALHRFELDTLTHTGSGRVPGTLLNDFSLSEHDGHLRVAVTEASPFIGIGRPMPVEGDGDVVTGGPTGRETFEPTEETTEATTVPTSPDESTTTTTEASASTTTEASTTTTTTEATTTTTSTTTTSTTTTEATTTTQDPNAPLNEVVVLDTEGDLDVVGRTPRFGHPGETLHGIRFVGDTAYAVTFLQTDPFYVIDLADPTQPRVAGEVELPGFSAYLHPVGDGLVAGFGPDGDGRAAVKLFDVSDPTRPRVADSAPLGDESPVVYDHHAFVDLGDGRFAVPATSWSVAGGEAGRCIEGTVCPEVAGPVQVESAVVVFGSGGGRLDALQRHAVALAQPATRLLPVGDGWAVVAGTEVALLDGAGAERGRLALG